MERPGARHSLADRHAAGAECQGCTRSAPRRAGSLSMTTVAVMGLGYVGLPLAVAFGRQVRTIGYDVSREKVASLQRGKDPAREVGSEALRSAKHVEFTADAAALKAADFILVAVPTP